MPEVLVLFGGRSAEHEVSCVSAATVVDALIEAGHGVALVGIDPAGGWHGVDPANRPLAAAGPELTLSVPDGRLASSDGAVSYDVVFPVLHGPYGEDGTIQGLLEVIGVPYVGAGVLASAAAMDKDLSNRLFREAGLPMAEFMSVERSGYTPGTHGEILEKFELPLFVKPAALGSSVGISKVDEDFELAEAMVKAFKHGDKALVEEAITGREIEVAVLEGPRTSVPGEVVTTGWYDYSAKYHDDATELLVPAPLTDREVREVQDLAAAAFSVLGVVGLARVDFFYEEGGRGFLLNELNTMPGCTSRSMFPLLWEASGMPNAELFDELVNLAVARGTPRGR
ncbi:MAG: D-alanine--D-alanine ligase family protein [Acidimicrobiia bacterium]